MKSCHFSNRPLMVNNYTLGNTKKIYKEGKKGLDCGSIFKGNQGYYNTSFNESHLKIKEDIYFEIIRLVRSKHKTLTSSGRPSLRRIYGLETHLIALFINDSGEWMTVGFDGSGISSPDIYFNAYCSYLLKQEYNYPNFSGDQLRTNRNKTRINENINKIYSDKQLKLSVLASSHLNKDQLNRFMEYSKYLTGRYNKGKKIYNITQFHPIGMRCRTANCASFLLYVFHDILSHDLLLPIFPSTIKVKNKNRNNFTKTARKKNSSSKKNNLNRLRSRYESLNANTRFTLTGYPKLIE